MFSLICLKYHFDTLKNLNLYYMNEDICAACSLSWYCQYPCAAKQKMYYKKKLDNNGRREDNN